MKYTCSRKADLIVEKELNVIKKVIVENIPGVLSIILFGSFGIGEGSYTTNKKIEIIGDYDLYLVTKKNIKEDLLREVSKKCALAIGKGGLDIVEDLDNEYNKKDFFHVDIRAIPQKKIKKLFPTQRTYDLKKSRVIFGKNFLDNVPNVKISLPEALRLLFNQANYLLVSEDKPKEIKIICAMKVIQNCCSALLISESRYEIGYKKRDEIFQKLPFPKKIKKYVETATKFKLKISIKMDEKKVWERAKDCLDFSLKHVLKKQTGKDLKNWKEIAQAIASELPYYYFAPYLPFKYFFPAQYYLNIKFVESSWKRGDRILKPLFTWKDAGLKIAAALLLYIYGERELAEYYIQKITNSKKYPLKKRILNFFTYYYSMKLV